MASWAMFDEQAEPRAGATTPFVVCDACAETADDRFGAAVVRGAFVLDPRHGRQTCPNGHPLHVQGAAA